MELRLAAAVLLVVVVSASDGSCLGCSVEQCRPSSASLKFRPTLVIKTKSQKNEARKLKKVK